MAEQEELARATANCVIGGLFTRRIRTLPCRVFEYGPGALLGASDFFMVGPARFRGVAAEPCRLLTLSREGLQRMTRQKPEVRACQHAPLSFATCTSSARGPRPARHVRCNDSIVH